MRVRYFRNSDEILKDFPTLKAFKDHYGISWNVISRGCFNPQKFNNCPMKYWSVVEKTNVFFGKGINRVFERELADYIITKDDGGLRVEKC